MKGHWFIPILVGTPDAYPISTVSYVIATAKMPQASSRRPWCRS